MKGEIDSVDPIVREMASKKSTRQKRTLLVDDNLLVLISLEGMFVALDGDWKTVKARDGREALKELESQTFDLIVTDYQMPGMNGLELVEAARQMLLETPVMMLTEHDDRELREQAHDLGVSCMLEKPVSGHLFLSKVWEALGYDR
jgi:CheY-like chemotaxis protein